MGLEPTALRLKVWCSTDWAKGAEMQQAFITFDHLDTYTEVYGGIRTHEAENGIAFWVQ